MVSDELVTLARRWAEQLPEAFARQLADALNRGADAVHDLPAPALPASVAVLREAREQARAGHGAYLSGALSALLEAQASAPVILPVWTGPHSPRRLSGRLTLAVVADLIGEAHDEILLVSYATAPGPEVRAALADAVARGVKLTVLLERAVDNAQFHGHPDPFAGIATMQLCWPGPRRPPGASLHAKVLVIDRSTALVGSANLTDYALERNLECGILIRGGPVPGALAEHLLTTDAFATVRGCP